MFEVRLTREAEDDVADLLAYTLREYGVAAEDRYFVLIQDSLRDLALDPHRPSVRQRDDIESSIWIYHLQHSRLQQDRGRRHPHRPRHQIIFRIFDQEKLVDVLRILHDAMDLAQHLPPDDGED